MPISPKRQAGRKRVAAKRKVSEIEGGDPSHTAAKKKKVKAVLVAHYQSFGLLTGTVDNSWPSAGVISGWKSYS